MKVKVLPIFDRTAYMPLVDKGWIVVSTVAKSPMLWERDLSPFVLGPCELYKGITSLTMENAWQYSKVYPHQVGKNGWPKKSWLNWAMSGWRNERAVRYPMGKGKKPAYSYWMDGEDNQYQLDYVEARKHIYAPLYMESVRKTLGYKKLLELYEQHNLVLLDFDAYDHKKLGMSLTDVLNDPTRKMGHAFVLAMMLTHSKALKQTGRL